MKFWRIFLALAFIFSINSACAQSSMESFCQSNIEVNTQRAQWGFDLRKEMLQKCVDHNLRICSQPYTDLVTRQERLDRAELEQQFEQTRLSAKTRFLLQAAAREKTSAAYMALRGAADTPEAVAQEIYAQCLTQEPRDLQAALQNGTLSSSVVPACSGRADPDYLKRCCTPDCFCDVYCQ